MTQLSFTYLTLTTALQAWLDDTDADWQQTFTPPSGNVGTSILVMDYLLKLGELRVLTDLDLTIFDTSNTVSLPAGTGTNNVVARPAGVIVTDELFYGLPSGPSLGKLVQIDRRDWGWIMDYLDPAQTGPPLYYAEQDATNYIFAPYADQTYTVTSFGVYAAQSLADIKASGTTWLSANVADLLLDACLIECAIFLKNEGKRKVTEADYQGKLATNTVRFRALRRDTTEQPRAVVGSGPEGQLPVTPPAP